MAAPATPTFTLNWLNTWFKDLDRMHNASILASPFLKQMRFMTTGGELVGQPFTLNAHRGDSTDFAAAQSISSQAEFRNSAKYRWLVPYGEYVGSITVEHRDIALSRTDRDAAARALKHDTEMAMQQRASNIMRKFFETLGSSLGSAALVAGVLTFTNREEAAKLFPGDIVQLSSNDGTTSTDTQVGSVGYVVKTETEVSSANTGKVSLAQTSNGAVANPAGVIDATYFVFRFGEFSPADNNAALTPIQAYLPAAPATSDLHNVKRSSHTLLSGLRLPDGELEGRTISSKIKRFIASAREIAGIEGGGIKTIVLNPIMWQDAEEEFSSTVGRSVTEETSDGFSSITVQTANGKTRLMSEPHCPRDVAFCLNMDQFVMHSPTGKIAQWADEEGSIVRRKETELVYEMTPVSYLAPVMKAPYAHGRFSTAI